MKGFRETGSEGGTADVEGSEKQEPNCAFFPAELDLYPQEWDAMRSQERAWGWKGHDSTPAWATESNSVVIQVEMV